MAMKVNVTAIPTPGTVPGGGLKVEVTALPVGFQGLQGEQGIQGVAGADGKTWYSGTSTPSDSLGVDGDFYLNTTTDDVYKKVSGTWGSPLLNIKGAKGDQGDPGAGGTALNNFNSFTYVWKDNATITVKSGGQAITADGSVTHTLTADTDLALPGGLDTGNEPANAKLYVWIGDGNVLKFSLSATSPTGLTNPVLLPGCVRNDGGSNIIPFQWEGGFYRYLSAIALGGSDKTQLFSGTAPTSGSPGTLDLSAFVPENKSGLVFLQSTYYAQWDQQHLWMKPAGGSYYQNILCGYYVAISSFTVNASKLSGMPILPYAFTWYADAAFNSTVMTVAGFWGK